MNWLQKILNLSGEKSIPKSPPDTISPFYLGVINSMKNTPDEWIKDPKRRLVRHITTGLTIELGTWDDGEDAGTTLELDPYTPFNTAEYKAIIDAYYLLLNTHKTTRINAVHNHFTKEIK